MATLFTPPRYTPVSGNGTTYPGGKLYFYTTGTSTPKNTYSDSSLVTPNANPVVADADGLFGVIYLASGDYKAILKDSSDTTIWTVDPVPGLASGDILTTRGDLLTRDASGFVRLPIGTASQVLTSNGTDAAWSTPMVARSSIQGLTYANNGSDATNDIDIAVGSAMDGTNTRMLILGSAITKRLDAAWTVGTNQGGLDTGSIGNSDYFIWLIERSDTGVVDVLFSLSATAPTMPSNYNYKRLIGWIRRSSGAILAFNTYELPGGGIEYAPKATVADINSAALTTSRLTSVISTPVGLSVVATLYVTIQNGGTPAVVRINCPDQTDVAISGAATLGNFGYIVSTTLASQEIRVRTDTSAQISARATAAITAYIVNVVKFEWSRR